MQKLLFRYQKNEIVIQIQMVTLLNFPIADLNICGMNIIKVVKIIIPKQFLKDIILVLLFHKQICKIDLGQFLFLFRKTLYQLYKNDVIKNQKFYKKIKICANVKSFIEGYCYQCEQDDFHSRISCKVGQNRILMNQKCVGLPGFYDPQNEDQISCDISWTIGLVYQIQNVLSIESNLIMLNVQMKASQAELKLIFLSMCNWICRLSFQVLEMWIKCDQKFQKFFQAAEQTTYQQSLTCIPGQNHVFPETFKSECQVNTEDFRRFYNLSLQMWNLCCYQGHKLYNMQFKLFQKIEENAYVYNHIMMIIQIIWNLQNVIIHLKHVQTVLKIKKMHAQNVLQLEYFIKRLDGNMTICLIMDSQKIINSVISIVQHLMDLFHQIVKYVIQNIEQWIYSLTCVELGIMIFHNQNVMPLFTITILVINFLIKIQKVVLFVLQNLILEYQKEISANLQMDIIKSMEQCKKCSYKCETCESQAEKCLTFLLNSLCILDSVKGCFCPKEYYNKQDSIVCQRCHFKCKS